MRYTKMHGAGNSFILIEDPRGEQKGEDLAVLALRLCDASRGPGADGLIVVTKPEGADLGMLFYNSDGSTGEMCGNGARCLARWGLEHGLAPDPERIRILAPAGEVRARRITKELYELRLNDPSVIDLERTAVAAGGECVCAYVELGEPGIPHAVVEVTEDAFSDLGALRERGRALRRSPSFPRGANVSFVCPVGAGRVRAITYERGVEDFTLACGTGCGAIAAALLLSGRMAGERLAIEMPGGELSVSLRKENGGVRDLLLTGPTAVVGEGEFSF
jgi:diaminopimelate epimerase